MKKKTAVFIDHESWYYGLLNLHGDMTNVDNVLGVIEEQNEVTFKKAFGNLPFGEKQNILEREKLSTYGYKLEHTFEGNVKGDLTDFVVVDSIYRSMINNPDIEKYIIISGDAHYLQVLRTLKEYGKEVEIWAVFGTISAVFNEFCINVIYPDTNNNDLANKITQEVFISDTLSSMITSKNLVKSVSEKYNITEDKVWNELGMLVSKGILKEINFLNKKNKKQKYLSISKESGVHKVV